MDTCLRESSRRRRPAPSPRVPRSRAASHLWPVRDPRLTDGRCPAPAARRRFPGPYRAVCTLETTRYRPGTPPTRLVPRRSRNARISGTIPGNPASYRISTLLVGLSGERPASQRGASVGPTGGADRVGPPTGWHRRRQIGDELVAGVEQFLLVDNVVAVEDGAALVAGQEQGDPLGDVRADQVAGGRTPGNRGGSGSAPRRPGRRCAMRCASAGRGCRRGGRPAGCRGRGAPAVAPGPRRWAARWGGCAPPASSSEPARAG